MVGPVRAGGLFEGGGTVWNTWKKGGTEKKGGETQILKSGGQAVSRGGCLKGMGGGARTPFQTMDGNILGEM